MRVPSGSSKMSARSKAHSSPSWLPSGVTFTFCAAAGNAASASRKMSRRMLSPKGLDQDDVELLLSVARLDLHRHALADEIRQHFERRRLFLEEAVDHALRREDAEFVRLVEGTRLAQDLAQDLVADGVSGLHFAASAAGRARLAQDVRQRLARALARHLDQAEPGEAIHRDAGAVAGERALELLQHGRAVRLVLHVDEIEHDDAAEV